MEAVLCAMMEAGRWGTDMDLGEMFLNFTLHESLQAFCGIDPILPGRAEEWLPGLVGMV
jgi:hypothetical protein